MRVLEKWKKSAAIVTVSCLTVSSSWTLTGCGQNKEADSYAAEEGEKVQITGAVKEKAMGRYLETDVNLPENTDMINEIRYLKDGSLRICYLDSDYESMYADSKDNGDTWGEAESLVDILGIDPDTQSVSYPHMGPDGSFFVHVTEYTGENAEDYALHYYYIDPQGKSREMLLDGIKDQLYITNSEFTEAGTILMNTHEGIIEVDSKDDSVVKKFEEGNYVDYFGLAGHYLIAVTNGEVHVYDVNTGKPVEDNEALGKQIKSNASNMGITSTSSYPLLCQKGDEENSIFYVDSTGMYRYVIGGSVVELIVDGKLNSIGSPDTGFVDMEQDSEGRFYLAVQDFASGNARLLRYTYSKDTPSVPDTQLRIYSLTENDYLRQVAALFQKKYPDIYLEVETGMTGDDAVTAVDAMKTLNTEIMAGKGPDILIFDGIGEDTYIEKGLLTDISRILAEIDVKDGILENILDSYTEEDGAVYCMPLKFGIPMVMGQQKDIERISDLITLADVIESHQDEYGAFQLPFYLSYTPEMVIRGLANVCAGAWISDDGTLNEEAVSAYLTETKRIYQAGKDAAEATSVAAGEDLSDYDFGMKNMTLSIGSGVSEVLCKNVLLSVGGLYSPSDVAMLHSAEEDNAFLSDGIWSGQQENCFLPSQIIGISSMANEKEAAEKFVEYLFSQEGQAIGSEEGLPVNQAIYDSMDYWMKGEEGALLWSWTSGNPVTGEMVEGEVRQPSKEVIAQIQELGKSLDRPSAINQFILNAVAESGVGYLKDETTLEEAVSAIVQEVHLYLSE